MKKINIRNNRQTKDHKPAAPSSQPSRPHMTAQRITLCALLAALALSLSWLESVLPFQPGLPGVRLGLPNLVIVFCLYRLDARSAAAVNAVRILLAGLMFSGLWGMLYSFSGAACSMAVMILLLGADRRAGASHPDPHAGPFSILGVSMAGGVFHNLGQLLIAMLAVTNANLFFYCPVLIVSGAVTGIVNGLIALVLLKKLPANLTGLR